MSLQSTVGAALKKFVQGQFTRSGEKFIDSKANGSLQKETYTVTTADTTTTITINGTAYTFTESGASESTTVIAAALVALINAAALGIVASNAANVITLVAITVGTGWTGAATANCAKAVVNHNASAIDFGLFVCVDSHDTKNCKLPAIATDITGRIGGGFTILTHARENTDGGYAINRAVEYASFGCLAVKAEEAVAPGDTVYVRFAAGTGSTIGAIRNDADSTTCAALDGARVLSYNSVTGLAEIQINLPY